MEPLDQEKWICGGAVVREKLLKEVDVCCTALRSDDKLAGGERFYKFIVMVWSLDTSLAMDAAEAVCNHARESGCLDVMVSLVTDEGSCDGLKMSVCKGIEQVMTSSNRCYLAQHLQFAKLVGVACELVGTSVECSCCATGILENLFKHSADTCLYLIQHRALDGVLKCCRSMDVTVLQHCAAALANCAMYGGPKCQAKMIGQQVDLWLFPLAFSHNDVVKYYALLAIVFLASNPDLQMKVERSGTLELVVPYLQSQDPEELPKKCQNHLHGRSASWLRRLVPLLLCDNEEARLLSAFHFAMEVSVKKKQHRLKLFYEIEAIEALFTSARESSRLTSDLCCQALCTCEEALPVYRYWDVVGWSRDTVSVWVGDLGLKEQVSNFRSHFITGSMLLDLASEDLVLLGLSHLQGRWFLQQLDKLRCVADVSSRDHFRISQWLTAVSRDFNKYKPTFVRHSVSPSLMPHLTESNLQELGVHNSVDRLRILLAARGDSCSEEHPDGSAGTSSVAMRYDVFVSYRRSNGSQLASLLKVHLELKGLRVFIDVKELGSGNFVEAILSNIACSSSVVVVLSPGALDRCKKDDNNEDWLHREVAYALEKNILVVPLMDTNFQWPKETELPEDIRHICSLNGVSWYHDYQDACVTKLMNFLPPPSLTLNRIKKK